MKKSRLMDKKLNFPVITTVVLNAFILIGAGHGFGFLFVYEILSLNFIFTDFPAFNWSHYDERLMPVSFLSLIFQILLLICLRIKAGRLKRTLITIFSLLLLLIFFVLVQDFSRSDLDKFSLISGIPFLISSLFLLFKVNFIKKS